MHLDYGAALVGWGVGKWIAASTSKEASVNFAKLNMVLFLREEGRVGGSEEAMERESEGGSEGRHEFLVIYGLFTLISVARQIVRNRNR